MDESSVIPLISNNSFELNAISLSDDSGFSGFTSHTRENELNSDEFESQFDSDSGMSAENFHTIKKISSSIIYEPPLEFQDNYSVSKFSQPNYSNNTTTSTTPSTVIRTTHIQSYASRLTQNIIRRAISSFHNLATKEVHYCEKHAAAKLKKQQQKKEMESEYLKSKKAAFVSHGYSNIYGSDSFLNAYNRPTYLSSGKSSNSNINIVDSDEDDIYDEPNAEYDVIYKDNKDTILCTKRIVRSLEKKKVDTRSHLYCNTEELFYDKLRSKAHSSAMSNSNHSSYKASHQHLHDDTNSSSNINRFQSNSFQKKFDKFLRRKFLTTNLTPTTTTSSIFYSFCHTGAQNVNTSNPNSKSSLNSRLSSSHNSLTVPTNKADDSIFITQAMSHDQLGHNIEISDFYNVPLDSDIYTLPIDVINNNGEEQQHHAYRHYRAMSDNNLLSAGCSNANGGVKCHKFHRSKNKRSKRKKRTDAVHDSSNVSSRKLSNASSGVVTSHSFTVSHENRKVSSEKTKTKVLQSSSNYANDSGSKLRKNSDSTAKVRISDSNNNTNTGNNKYGSTTATTKKSQFSISLNLKQKFCSIFRFKKSHQTSPSRNVIPAQDEEKKVNLLTRALPPLPSTDAKVSADPQSADKKNIETMDFAANIEKVRECGWYWGPLTSEAAEKILSNEPDGSFIVRDSSDLNYIFSLTVKLNGCIRHVRIEQEQGTFSFGSCAQIKCSYKSRTIKEFIENAVEHSRSGRYLFFLHRRPEHGPMRVQLLNPVSRFRHVQSLQHMCRFVILKAVQRKDLIETLPLPRRLLDYLQNKNFLSELIESDSSSQSQVYGENNNNSDTN